MIVKPDPPVLYCDCSHRKGQLTTVAGAIASVEDWRDFHSEWNQALVDNGLKYFRMVEFAHSVGQFAIGWKNHEERRRAFMLRLAQTIVDHVASWVGVSVSQKDYDAADVVYELHEYLQPFPLCAITCIELALRWRKLNNLDYLPMQYIFEEGDEHSAQLSKRSEEQFGESPLFVPKISRELQVDGPPLTPLQVGDFVAYEIGKFYSIVDAEVEELFQRFRGSFRLIGDLPQQWGNLSEQAIRVGANLRGVPKRHGK